MRARTVTSRAAGHDRQRLPFDELHRDEAALEHVADLVDGDDVRMIQRRGGARFLLEAADRVAVAGQARAEQLDGDLAAEPRVVCEIDLAHAAAADERQHLIGADAPGHGSRFLLAREPSGGQVHRRYRRRSRPPARGRRAAIPLPVEAPRPCAGGAKETRAAFTRQLQRGVKELPDLLVLLGVHLPPPSSRKSQACARLQSRLHRSHRHVEHVCRLLQAQARRRTAVRRRGSGAGSAPRASSSASSSATRSTSGPAGTSAASESVTCSWPWPRLARSRGAPCPPARAA